MKRIVDEPTAQDEVVTDLVEALRARPVDPFLAGRVRAHVDGTGRRPARRLRPLGVLAALLVFAALSAASAMVVRRIVRGPAPTTAPTEQPTPPRATGGPTPVVTPLPLPDAPAAPPARTTGDAAESQLIADAYAALRQHDDPPTALRRIDSYLTLYPRGALIEEALALALDAAQGEAARRYAERYLARFPDGEAAGKAKAILEKTP